MFGFVEKAVVAASMTRTIRQLGAVTAPQLMRLVNDLDKRVYRQHIPLSSNAQDGDQIEPFKVSLAEKLSGNSSELLTFGGLATQSKCFVLTYNICQTTILHSKLLFNFIFMLSDETSVERKDVESDESEETINDHHLRLSKSGRRHEPSWYLGKINRLCKEGKTQDAVEVHFK